LKKYLMGKQPAIRLMGRAHGERVEGFKALNDVEGVRFLGICEAAGVV
jgi:hypothetical protein